MDKKKVLMIIGIVLGIIIICGSLTTIVVMSLENARLEKELKALQDNKKEEVMVPNVVGMKKENAISTLEDKGLKVSVSFVNDSNAADGVVVKSEPEYEEKVEKGSKVTIYVSIGGEKVIVEDYKGKSYLIIKTSLEAQGIIVKVEKKEASDKYDYNQIVDQSVEPGKTLSEGDSITLYIPDSPKIYYPDFTTGEYTEKEVKEFCDRYGITLTVFYDEPDGTQIPSGEMPEEGKVFAQDKTTKDEIKDKDKLTIKVARY